MKTEAAYSSETSVHLYQTRRHVPEDTNFNYAKINLVCSLFQKIWYVMPEFYFFRYGLGGLGIHSWWRRDLAHPSRPTLGPTQPPIPWVPGLSLLGLKRPGRDVNHPSPSSAEVGIRGLFCDELYLVCGSRNTHNI
jgi:hypothetical protein